MKTIIAIDPGKNGAIVVKKPNLCTPMIFKMPVTPEDKMKLLGRFKDDSICYLEKVHAMPRQSGMFSFGFDYGCLVSSLIFWCIPTESITPQKWMKSFELGTKGNRTDTQWKNHLKAKAQLLYPGFNVTLWNADALLILTYGLKNK